MKKVGIWNIEANYCLIVVVVIALADATVSWYLGVVNNGKTMHTYIARYSTVHCTIVFFESTAYALPGKRSHRRVCFNYPAVISRSLRHISS